MARSDGRTRSGCASGWRLWRQSLPLQQTIVLGFSQGAAMALDVAADLPVAAVIACSGYPHPGWSPHAPLPPILLSHGRADPVVPYAASEELQRGSGAAPAARAELLGFPGATPSTPPCSPSIRSFLLGAARPAAPSPMNKPPRIPGIQRGLLGPWARGWAQTKAYSYSSISSQSSEPLASRPAKRLSSPT